jgi:uncharacterized membrane protein
MRGWLTRLLLAGCVALALAACARQESPPSPADSQDAAETSSAADIDAAESASVEPPAESGLAIKRGVVMLAQDRTTFRPCEESSELWVLDQTDGVLSRTFADESANSPMMLYMEAYGVRAPADAVPEARGYAGVLVLEEVLYAGLQEQVKGCGVAPANYIVAARGNEPFWAVEITEDQIVWRQPEAPKEIILSSPQTADAEGAVRYRASGSGREVDVLIDAQPCRDGMSGEFFAYSAKALLDGREFSGCARVGR